MPTVVEGSSRDARRMAVKADGILSLAHSACLWVINAFRELQELDHTSFLPSKAERWHNPPSESGEDFGKGINLVRNSTHG